MEDSKTDRDLLFVILALQMDFVASDALVTALGTCASSDGKPVGQVLRSQGALSKADVELLESLVCRLMEKHDNNARRSLEAVTAATVNSQVLDNLGKYERLLHLAFAPNSTGLYDEIRDTVSPHAAESEQFAGPRFRLLRFHARGGLGEVWVAHDRELNREVALKRIREQWADSPHSQTRFLHEAEVTGCLEHRGIVSVYSVGRFENGHPFYAMRLVSGTSLKEAIVELHEEKRRDPASVDRSMEMRRLLGRFVDVCNTVAYAHSRGVLHRDLKPANIILDDYGETLVVDWGLAKTGSVDEDFELNGAALPPVSTISTPYSRAGAQVGTPGFMSPEQAAGRLSELGPATDVYSLGATLHCLLTGKSPSEAADPSSTMPNTSAADLPGRRQFTGTAPAALEAICLKAMATSPNDRFSSARELADEVERWLADQPVLAYPEPLPTRVFRWIRRHKQWVSAAAVLLVLTALGLAIYNWRITAEKVRTSDQLAMTRDALRELLAVSGENLAFIPNTEKLREDLAQLVLDRYQQLGNRFPNDPGVRLETAHVFRVIGGIRRLTGQFAGSQASYEKAIQELKALAEEYPGQAKYRRWLVEAFIERGELDHMNGRTIEAESDFHAAITHADQLRSEPLSRPYRRTMGSALTDLSEILVLKRQHAEAQAAADQAVELLTPLSAASIGPDGKSRDRWLLSLALTDRGIASREAGGRERAAHDFDAAARVATSIAEGDEIYDDSQFQLASIANQRGELLSADVSKLPECESNYNQAAQILTRLMASHKSIPHYREEMAVTLSGRAEVRLAMKRIPDAERDCHDALDYLAWLIGEQTRNGAPENPQYLSLLGRVLDQQSRLCFLKGQAPEGTRALAEGVEKLSRAIQLDPARATEKLRLEQIKARPAQRKE